MATLADRGVNPAVVDDFSSGGSLLHRRNQPRHRPSAQDAAPYGTYNLSNDGDPTTWAGIARAVFEARGRDAASVRPVTTAEYAAGKSLAPRPRHSVLHLRQDHQFRSNRRTR